MVDRIEPAGWGRFYLGLDGMAEMYRGETGLFDALLATCQPEFRPRLGVARGKFPAFCAAALATAGDVQRVHGGSEAVAAWLATLPVGWRPPTWSDRKPLASARWVSWRRCHWRRRRRSWAGPA